MKRTKLLTILAVLNDEEWKTLKKHVLLHCRTESDVFRIFEFFWNHREKLNVAGIDGLAEAEFPNISQKVFSNHMSTLYQWTENWLAYEEMCKEKYSKDLLLIKALNHKGLYTLTDHIESRLQKNIDSNVFDLENNKARTTLLEQMYFSNHPAKYERGTEMLHDLTDSYLKQINEHLILYLSELYNWQSLKNVDLSYEINSFQDIIKLLPESKLGENLKMLLSIVKDYDYPSLENLSNQLFNGLFGNNSHLHSVLTYYLIIYTSKFRAKGYLNDIKQIARLYEYALKNEVLMQNGKITTMAFNNLIGVTSMTESYEWNIKFINKWVQFVDSKNIESSKSIVKAIVCLNFEKYNEIPQFTNLKEFTDFDQKFKAHSLYLISLFMNRKNEYDMYSDFLEKFMIFVKRNKKHISVKNFKAYSNLADFIDRYDKSDRTAIDIDINKYEFLMNRTWCENILKRTKKEK